MGGVGVDDQANPPTGEGRRREGGYDAAAASDDRSHSKVSMTGAILITIDHGDCVLDGGGGASVVIVFVGSDAKPLSYLKLLWVV